MQEKAFDQLNEYFKQIRALILFANKFSVTSVRKKFLGKFKDTINLKHFVPNKLDKLFFF